MRFHTYVIAALVSACAAGPVYPQWTGPFLDPLLPYGGMNLTQGVSHFQLYRATEEIGTYNMSPMLDFFNGQFLATWKNSPTDEDQPGQRVLYSQSLNGLNWTATDGSNVMFPNMSTNSFPVALFAEPTLHINGHAYAAASPKQFCLYPDQYADILLLRRVFTPGIGQFGPIFWAASTVPPGFEPVTAALGILTINQTDATTQADISTLANTGQLPCGPVSDSLKCEACLNGCQQWPASGSFPNTSNERTHYVLPGGGDVILYRSTRGILNLHASVRSSTTGEWQGPVLTNFPDDNANLNAGPLPDGRVYLLSNAMPNLFRDPLYLSTSFDGLNWNTTTALTSCTLPIYTAPDQPLGCLFRFNGGAKQSGCQYPQGISVLADGVEGFYAIFALNKEDIYVVHAPFSSF